ncbi:hypothetical protein [Sphaerisporangium sp. NPDC051011]|uniref:hypothetical protein n=1 Tax=Sphaerisporangium sp. NPDC051011 TaxID=3155792 RepID=UPI0033C6DDAF
MNIEIKAEGHWRGESVYVNDELRGYVRQGDHQGQQRWFAYSSALRSPLSYPARTKKAAAAELAR